MKCVLMRRGSEGLENHVGIGTPSRDSLVLFPWVRGTYASQRVQPRFG